MVTSFETIEKARTIIFKSQLLALAASVCDMLEHAGIPAVLCREKGSPIVVVPPDYASETRQLLDLAWAGLQPMNSARLS
jgi:hypothetical protein